MSDPTAPAPSDPTQPNPGRDASGRFTRGNPGGPGNPYARRSAQLRQRMQALTSDEEIDVIFKALLKRARDGEHQSAQLVLAYAVGKPGPAPDPDTIDVHELEVLKQRCRKEDV